MFSLSSPASSANPCRQRRKRRQISASSSSASVSAACGVCGSENCNRGHDSSSSGSVYAFSNGAVGPKIPKIIDDALQDFFDMTLKKYVEKWYETLISREDKTFVKQLRIHIRYALCQCWCRLQHVDLPHVILDEVVPVAINHAAVYADVRRQNSGSLGKTDTLSAGHTLLIGLFLRKLGRSGPRTHVVNEALTSRDAIEIVRVGVSEALGRLRYQPMR